MFIIGALAVAVLKNLSITMPVGTNKQVEISGDIIMAIIAALEMTNKGYMGDSGIARRVGFDRKLHRTNKDVPRGSNPPMPAIWRKR